MKNILFVFDDHDVETFFYRYSYIFKENNITVASEKRITIRKLKTFTDIDAFSKPKGVFFKLKNYFQRFSLSDEERDLLTLSINNNIIRNNTTLENIDYNKILNHYASVINYIQKKICQNNFTDVIVTDTIYVPAICYALAGLRENIAVHLRTAPYTKEFSNAFKEIHSTDELYEHPWQLPAHYVNELIINTKFLNNDENLLPFDCLVIVCHRLNDMNLLNGHDWFDDYVDWLDQILNAAKSISFKKPIYIRPHPTEQSLSIFKEVIKKYPELIISIDDNADNECPFSYTKNSLFLTIRGTIFTEALSQGVRCVTTSRTRYSIFGNAIFGSYSEAMTLIEFVEILKSGQLMSISERRQELARAITTLEKNGLNLEFGTQKIQDPNPHPKKLSNTMGPN